MSSGLAPERRYYSKKSARGVRYLAPIFYGRQLSRTASVSTLAEAALLLDRVPDVVLTHIYVIIPIQHAINRLHLREELGVIQLAPIRMRQIGRTIQDARTTIVKRDLQPNSAQPLNTNDLVQKFHFSEAERS